VRSHAFVVLGIILLGCSQGLTPKPPETGPAVEDQPPPAAERMTMEAQGVDLRLFPTSPTAGVPRKPTFWLHTDVFRQTEEGLWSFGKARAIIYAHDAADPDITMEAGQGRFQEAKMAYLKDAVVVRIGAMTLELEDIEWLNDTEVAQTDNPVRITTEDWHLQAANLRLYHKQKQIVMTNGIGSMRFDTKGFERKQP
jgi:hypothetical protein